MGRHTVKNRKFCVKYVAAKILALESLPYYFCVWACNFSEVNTNCCVFSKVTLLVFYDEINSLLQT